MKIEATLALILLSCIFIVSLYFVNRWFKKGRKDQQEYTQELKKSNQLELFRTKELKRSNKLEILRLEILLNEEYSNEGKYLIELQRIKEEF